MLHRFAPLTVVAIASSLISVGLLVWAVLVNDGVAVIAVILMSCSSTVLGLANLWMTPLACRDGRYGQDESKSHAVVVLPGGGFFVVHASEYVHRQLFWGSEQCLYQVHGLMARGLSGVIGGLMVLVGVVLLGNCSWTMQAATGSAYAILNVTYWLVTLLPERWTWNLNHWSCETTAKHRTPSYIEALWTAMKYTRSTRWASQHGLVPHTSGWEEWLVEAQHQIDKSTGEKDVPWDCRGALAGILNDATGRKRV